MQNQTLFKSVKKKKKVTRRRQKLVSEQVLKKKFVLAPKDQEELLEKMLIKQKSKVLSKVEKKVLKVVCKKGLDEKYRRHLWLRASGASAVMKENKGYYRRLKATPMQYPNPSFN